jgi:hypothetical protein
MSDLDLSRITSCWRDASDADVARALGHLGDYPREVHPIIATEAARRGVEAGAFQPFESPAAQYAKRGLAAASRHIQSNRVLYGVILGAALSPGMLFLGPYAARWPALLRYGLFPTVCLLGLGVVCWPLRSYRDLAIAASAACAGHAAVNLALLLIYYPRGSIVPLYAMAAVVLIWVFTGALVWAAVWLRNRYWPVHRPGYCAHCGYNLRGLPKPRCPECGHAFDPAEVRGDPDGLPPPLPPG